MQIAIIGWGSLIWCPGSLQMKSLWHRDGPILPIEYARISSGDRLTLVIHPGSRNQHTLWTLAASEYLDTARELSRVKPIDPSGLMERAMGIEPTSEAWGGTANLAMRPPQQGS
jgi:hypothetical protein